MSLIRLIDLLESRVDFLRKDFLKRVTIHNIIEDMGFRPIMVNDLGINPADIERDLDEWPGLEDIDKQRVSDDLAELVFELIAANDPDPKKSNLQWIIRQLFRKNIMLEDLVAVKEALVTFDQLKRRRALTGAYAQLQNYKTYSDLIVKIREFIVTPSGAPAPLKYEEEMNRHARVALDDAQYLVISPLTKEAVQWFGRDTDWCSAWGSEYGRHPDKTYIDYLYRGPLYIITLKDTGEKFQLHFETNQLRDPTDKAINANEFWLKHPRVFDLFMRIRKVGPYDPNVNEPDPDELFIGSVEVLERAYGEDDGVSAIVFRRGGKEASKPDITKYPHSVFQTEVRVETTEARLDVAKYGDGLEITGITDWSLLFGNMIATYPRELLQYLHDRKISLNADQLKKGIFSSILNRFREAGIYYNAELRKFQPFEEFAKRITDLAGMPPKSTIYKGTSGNYTFWYCVDEQMNHLSEVTISTGDGASVKMMSETDDSVDWIASICEEVWQMVKESSVTVSEDVVDKMSPEAAKTIAAKAPLLLSFEYLEEHKHYKEYISKLASNADDVSFDENGNVVMVEFKGYEEDLIKEYGDDEAKKIAEYNGGGEHYDVNGSESIDSHDFSELYNDLIKRSPEEAEHFLNGLRKWASDGEIDMDDFFNAMGIEAPEEHEYSDDFEWYVATHSLDAEAVYQLINASEYSYKLGHFADRLGEMAVSDAMHKALESSIEESNFVEISTEPGKPSIWKMIVRPVDVVKFFTSEHYSPSEVSDMGAVRYDWLSSSDNKIKVAVPYNGWDTYFHISKRYNPEEYSNALEAFGDMDWFD